MKVPFNLKIQLFAEAPEGGGSGGTPTNPTVGEGQTTTPAAQTPGAVEVPEYLNNYVSGIEDEGQREYLTGLMQDEKAVNLLKGLIQDPNAEWTVKADDYKDMTDDVDAFITAAKEKGIPENTVKYQLDARKAYLAAEKEKMTPEQIALEPIINNFISAEKDTEIQGVYARLAENAAGRRVLEKLIKQNTAQTPGLQGGATAGATEYTEKSFIEAYNEAKPVNGEVNKQALRALEDYARNNSNPFFKDFLGIK